MLAIEKNMNVYKTNIISSAKIKSKFNHEKESTKDMESEFESQIKKIFQQKKFSIDNQYDHNGVESFLKEKDECLKKMELDDSILYKDLNMKKKSKNQKNEYKSHNNLKPEDIKIKNNNQKVIDSFISNKSEGCIEELLELLN